MLQAGWRVRCESGLVWLTQNGDAIDHLLREGQEWQCNHAGHAVLQALEQAGAVVEISSCATAPPK